MLDDQKLRNKRKAPVHSSFLRRTDMLIRMGGDEFLLVMPDITDQIFADKLKQIQEKVHDTKVPGYSQLRLSVSIGGVLSAPGSTVENAIHKADQFMYQAKTCKNEKCC